MIVERNPEKDDHVEYDAFILRTALAVVRKVYLADLSYQGQGIGLTTIQTKTAVMIRHIFCQLSVCKLPFRPIDSQVEIQRTTRPSNLVAWQYVGHLMQLSGKEKNMIKKMQKDNGYKQSDFSAPR